MAFDWKKMLIVLGIPAILIYASVQVFPPMLTPFLGPIAGQYTGAVASILTIMGVLWFYKRYIAKKSTEI